MVSATRAAGCSPGASRGRSGGCQPTSRRALRAAQACSTAFARARCGGEPEGQGVARERSADLDGAGQLGRARGGLRAVLLQAGGAGGTSRRSPGRAGDGAGVPRHAVRRGPHLQRPGAADHFRRGRGRSRPRRRCSTCPGRSSCWWRWWASAARTRTTVAASARARSERWPQRYRRIFKEIGRLAQEGAEAMAGGRSGGAGRRDEREPWPAVRAAASPRPDWRTWCTGCGTSGALGAKLTGAGGDGGAVIGLFQDPEPAVRELTRQGIRCFGSQLAGPRTEGAVSGMKATALAHPNIALVKYWGKRDEALILPHQSSLSMTLVAAVGATTVAFGEGARTRWSSTATWPRAASGTGCCACWTRCAARRRARSSARRDGVARGLPGGGGPGQQRGGLRGAGGGGARGGGTPGGPEAASVMARLGCGSACRSVQGGFCELARASARTARTATRAALRREALAGAAHGRGDGQPRREGSEVARRHEERGGDVPVLPAWVRTPRPRSARPGLPRPQGPAGAGRDVRAQRVEDARHVARGRPAALLPAAEDVGAHRLPARAAEEGRAGWFTLDAGPNPCILTDAANEVAAEAVARACGATDVVRCVPGGDARLLAEHLF